MRRFDYRYRHNIYGCPDEELRSSSGYEIIDSRTQGFWKRQCRGPLPSGEPDNLPGYVDAVNHLPDLLKLRRCCRALRSLETSARNNKCEQAEAQLMAALNVASGRLATCNCIDDPDHARGTVGEVLADLDALLLNPDRSSGGLRSGTGDR